MKNILIFALLFMVSNSYAATQPMPPTQIKIKQDKKIVRPLPPTGVEIKTNLGDKIANKVEQDVIDGKTVVVTITNDEIEGSEELSDDINSVLNDFKSEEKPAGTIYSFYEVKVSEDKSLHSKLKDLGLPLEGNYTLFFKKDKPNLVYSGDLLEIMVFSTMQVMIGEKSEADLDFPFEAFSDGLEEFELN